MAWKRGLIVDQPEMALPIPAEQLNFIIYRLKQALARPENPAAKAFGASALTDLESYLPQKPKVETNTEITSFGTVTGSDGKEHMAGHN